MAFCNVLCSRSDLLADASYYSLLPTVNTSDCYDCYATLYESTTSA